MKIRTSFVSNSSSSSFTCDVCGNNVSGMDMSIEESGMYQCRNGHTFCRDHMVGELNSTMILIWLKLRNYDKDYKEMKNKTPEEVMEWYKDSDYQYEIEYEMPATVCPCCTFKYPTDYDMLRYLLKKSNLMTEEVAKEMREQFETFNKFREYLK